MSVPYYTICLLPWIHFDEAFHVNECSFLPFPEHGFGDDFKCSVNEVLKSYRDINQDQITQCTLAVVQDKSPIWQLDESEGDLGKVEHNLALFFLAAFASNDYGGQHATYCNSSPFQPIFQNLTIPPRGKAVQQRRRYGSLLDGGYNHGDLIFSRPLECKSLRLVVDKIFLAGLDSVAKSQSNLYRRILNSLSFVRLANTDQSHMSFESEAVLLAAAFEILFDADDKYSLTCKYRSCFDDYKTKIVSGVLQERPGIKLEEGENKGRDLQWQLGRKWIQELYDLRSSVVHGSDLSARQWGWHPFEHLLIGAFVYPLAVKILLKNVGRYTLSNKDKLDCMAIDFILASNDWCKPVNERSNQSNWQKAVSDAMWQSHSMDFAEMLKKDSRRSKGVA
ncbi:MAG: hypothetical protein COV45_02655 [Deltaproteobacteria bacterium CG11_big_fil_rev_8_21_14_0_20_47_16]|nr:MAG: hypothetical protein COV45_02655 [Deltaproteobacteria bacterium CG11_big_fil_rev_8_21_14_0_20_47_16]